jgi:hypothetical protein
MRVLRFSAMNAVRDSRRTADAGTRCKHCAGGGRKYSGLKFHRRVFPGSIWPAAPRIVTSAHIDARVRGGFGDTLAAPAAG